MYGYLDRSMAFWSVYLLVRNIGFKLFYVFLVTLMLITYNDQQEILLYFIPVNYFK